MSAPTTSGAADVPSSCAANSEQKLPSREEQLAAMTARVEELQKQDPSADLKLEQKWWVPSLDFGSYLQDALPQEISAQFNAIFAKLIQDKFAPEAVAKARKQSRELLQAEYPQALERVEETVFKNEAQFAELHRHLQGVDSIGCAGGNC
ncbi:hypothetical protein B0H65DRAFT_324805 [Neurospora tetraspora]|uniref:Uncharacterized protein n=1 Tax=Neurospora tetraspora TaxID=94610 RepID=A0AAE0J7Y6_9PEZI|nr:hypothetical protein B0H65DRAFT_324805 [Neurospora tetraspora]